MLIRRILPQVSRRVFTRLSIITKREISGFLFLKTSSGLTYSQKIISSDFFAKPLDIAHKERKFSSFHDMSLNHIPNSNLYISRPTRWLESRFHFSFAEYYNPSNVEFGALRVLNDDLVKPRSGFGTHPHRDMEIVTYVVDGKITHKDSMGTAESLGRGSVQYMSAGTGVTHSEMNNEDKMLRFLQIWIKPNARGLKPNYGSRVFSKEDRQNKLQHILSSFDSVGKDSGTGVIPVHQDVNMYVAELEAGKAVDFTLNRHRQLYMVCVEGGVIADGGENSATLSAKDALTAVAPKTRQLDINLRPTGEGGCHVFLIEMAQK